MKLHNIKIVNFKSMYGEHFFDFDKLQGLVKLSGPIGTGKTSLGEAVCAVLFGKVKNQTIPQLVAWGTDTFELEADITSKGHSIHIKRNPKKQLEVTVDGKLLGAPGKTDMQAALEEFYDIPKMAVEKMCVISFSAFNSFAQMTPNETKKFLDDIFGFKVFTEYNDEVEVERKAKQDALTECSAVLRSVTAQIAETAEKQAARQKELSNSVDISALERRIEELTVAGTKKRVELDTLTADYNSAVASINKRSTELEKKKAEAAALGKVHKDSYSKFCSGKCPTCGHDISDDVISHHKEIMDKCAADWRKYDTELQELKKEYADINSAFRDKSAAMNAELSQARAAVTDINTQIRSYKHSIEMINENYGDLIRTLEEKKSAFEEQVEEYTKDISEWNEMNELFTKTLRYQFLDSIIPHINTSIQYYINRFEQGYKVHFDQEFKIHIFTDNIAGEISYANLSTGQKKTLDLAVTFGILQNIIANVDFNVLFLDELMSNLDANSRNNIIEVISDTVDSTKAVFVINHAEMSDDFFQHKVRVYLKNLPVQLSKSRLKKAVDTGSGEIIARASVYEITDF